MSIDYTEILPRGEENAISSTELMLITGLSRRALRRDIERSRRDGQLICSCNNGYYIPEKRSELLKFSKRYESMANSIYFTLRATRKALIECENQISLE